MCLSRNLALFLMSVVLVFYNLITLSLSMFWIEFDLLLLIQCDLNFNYNNLDKSFQRSIPIVLNDQLVKTNKINSAYESKSKNEIDYFIERFNCVHQKYITLDNSKPLTALVKCAIQLNV